MPTKAKVFSTLIKPFIGSGIGNIPFVAKAYRNLTPYLIGGKKGIIDFGDFKMQIPGNRVNDVITLFIANGKYEPATTRAFREILKEGDTVVDVGANIGYFSLLSSRLVGGKGCVIAFEPEPHNIESFRRNVTLNRFTNTGVNTFAIGNYNGESEFHISTNDPAHSLVKAKVHSSSIVVKVRKLDVFEIAKANLIKTDTEGNELAVLRGAEKLIKRSPDIKLIIEVNPDLINVKELWDLVKSLGMNMFYILNDCKDTITQCYTWEELDKASRNPMFYVNLLCTK
jgi:FkbM family methyltransferase